MRFSFLPIIIIHEKSEMVKRHHFLIAEMSTCQLPGRTVEYTNHFDSLSSANRLSLFPTALGGLITPPNRQDSIDLTCASHRCPHSAGQLLQEPMMPRSSKWMSHWCCWHGWPSKFTTLKKFPWNLKNLTLVKNIGNRTPKVHCQRDCLLKPDSWFEP